MKMLKKSASDMIKKEKDEITAAEEKIVANDRINENINQDAEQVVDDSKSKNIIYQ